VINKDIYSLKNEFPTAMATDDNTGAIA